MRLLRLGVLSVLGAIVTASAGVARADTAPDPPVLDHGTSHSKSEALAVAHDALNLVAFPPGATRLADRPPAGLASTGPTAGVSAQVNVTRWEAVPGSVTDAAAWEMAHGAPGVRIVGSSHGLDVSLEWSAASPFDFLPFSLSAWLARDGDHVDVTLTANVEWTPPRTAVETIPASVRSALLDYREGSQTFGASSRHLVTGRDLERLRLAVNALPTSPGGGGHCPPNNGGSTTMAWFYGGHRVVMVQDDKCGETSVVSDGHPQPALAGAPYALVSRLEAAATPAASSDVAPATLVKDVFSKAAAERRASALLEQLSLPVPLHKASTPDPRYGEPNVATQSAVAAWAVSVGSAVHYLTTHVPHGFVVAHVGPAYQGITQVILQPAHAYPAGSLLSVTVSARGSGAALRIDAEAMWLSPRSPQELVPASVATARATVYPVGGQSERIFLTGKAVRSLTQAFDTLKPARSLFRCPPSRPSHLLKLEVVYRIPGHVITFYWYNLDCQLGVLVDGRRSVGLADPPTALVERLLHGT